MIEYQITFTDFGESRCAVFFLYDDVKRIYMDLKMFSA